MIRGPSTSTLFPYTTLFRSTAKRTLDGGLAVAEQVVGAAEPRLDVLPVRHVVDGVEAELLHELAAGPALRGVVRVQAVVAEDRKSTRLNSSHTVISYAVFCL